MKVRVGLGLAAVLLATGAAADDAGRLVRAIELPAAAQALRDAGVPQAEVATALNASKGHGLRADETVDVLRAGAGGVDNFGSFVQEQLDKGLRGRDLARAIHEEQARRGMGPGERGKGKGKGPPEDRGPDEDVPPGQEGDGPDRGKGKGPPEDAGGGDASKGKGKGKGGH